MRNSLIALVLCWFAGSSFATKDLTEEYLRSTTEAFLNAKNARQQPDTTIEDIDHFLSFIADEFIDEHIRFDVVETDKQQFRQNLIAKMKDEVHFSKLTIDQMLVGSNVVFVKYTEHAKVKPAHLDKVMEYTATNIMSLEFDGEGLIKHIRRHHG